MREEKGREGGGKACGRAGRPLFPSGCRGDTGAGERIKVRLVREGDHRRDRTNEDVPGTLDPQSCRRTPQESDS